jgi:cardiolipin synthase
MKLMVQPDDGIQLLLKGIASATRSIEIVIFRFDRRDVERALTNAVTRGVAVHALIAHTNRAGEEYLRKLELRLLGAGVTVARTSDDLVRYHGKLMLADRRELYLLAFNWTYLDIDRSRSFGIITRSPVLVQEAKRLFDADARRHPFEPGPVHLVVSPLNARKKLSTFLKGAKESLLIYDPRISDPAMIHLLDERARAGVKIRILGRLTRRIAGVEVNKLAQTRLHTRTMVRDGNLAFVGSQSLRALELDARREIGVIFREPKAVARLIETFTHDWTEAEESAHKTEDEAPGVEVARRVAKLVTKELPEVATVVNGAVKELVGDKTDILLNPDEVDAAIKGAVKDAVKDVVSDMIQEAVEAEEGREP